MGCQELGSACGSSGPQSSFKLSEVVGWGELQETQFAISIFHQAARAPVANQRFIASNEELTDVPRILFGCRFSFCRVMAC